MSSTFLKLLFLYLLHGLVANYQEHSLKTLKTASIHQLCHSLAASVVSCAPASVVSFNSMRNSWNHRPLQIQHINNGRNLLESNDVLLLKGVFLHCMYVLRGKTQNFGVMMMTNLHGTQKRLPLVLLLARCACNVFHVMLGEGFKFLMSHGLRFPLQAIVSNRKAVDSCDTGHSSVG